MHLDPVLSALVLRAHHETTSTEAVETTRKVAAFTKGEDPVRFLLKELDKAAFKAHIFEIESKRWDALVNLVSCDKLVALMVNSSSGQAVPETIVEFLERLREEWNPQLKNLEEERLKQYLIEFEKVFPNSIEDTS